MKPIKLDLDLLIAYIFSKELKKHGLGFYNDNTNYYCKINVIQDIEDSSILPFEDISKIIKECGINDIIHSFGYNITSIKAPKILNSLYVLLEKTDVDVFDGEIIFERNDDSDIFDTVKEILGKIGKHGEIVLPYNGECVLVLSK